MNKERRKLLNQIQTEIEAIKERTERILEAEQEAFENMPEGLQQSERGEKTESAIGCIEYIMQSLDEAIEQINEACE